MNVIQCECGHATGMLCDELVPSECLAVVRWVPVRVRRERMAKGLPSVGDGQPLRVAPACASLLLSFLQVE